MPLWLVMARYSDVGGRSAQMAPNQGERKWQVERPAYFRQSHSWAGMISMGKLLGVASSPRSS